MHDFLTSLGIQESNHGAHDGKEYLPTSGGEELVSLAPATGKPIGKVIQADAATYDRLMERAVAAFQTWRSWPAPRRGEVVREIGEVLRAHKKDLGRLVSHEMGKILSEGEGEVQEMIDICDFAVGLSRQLYGLSMHSERPGHRMFEQWHPLGVVGIVTAFNFPAAVWAWNAAIAAVCGDAMIWKPSSKTPLCAVAVQNLIRPVVERHGIPGVFSMVIGSGKTVGERLIADRRIPLISATGSCRMGKRIGEVAANRFARTILELGGNNGIIVLDDADKELVLRAVLFGAVGTAGQRCTTTRRLFLHEKIHDEVLDRLVRAYKTIRVGDPLEAQTVMGPLIDDAAIGDMMKALDAVRKEGGEILTGGNKLDRPGSFVEPTIVKAHAGMKIVREETFAPILYVFKIKNLDEAIALHNSVDQGLSSALFTTNMLSVEKWLAAGGSDCGIANVNIGTSGAEIGGAFGGEKDTGGGREAGSDSWKVYMRRQTCTINGTNDLPLAQGVRFGVD